MSVYHTYFVGRRPDEAAEVYAVTENDVRRLDREWLDGPLSLDWRGHNVRVLQLSRVLLARVTGIAPTRELAEQFALSILADLPHDGFVLRSDEVWRWLRTVGAPRAVAQAKPRREWSLARLSSLGSSRRRRTHDRVGDEPDPWRRDPTSATRRAGLVGGAAVLAPAEWVTMSGVRRIRRAFRRTRR